MKGGVSPYLQFSITPILEASLEKISSEFSELASAVEATTHRLPTTGIIVPTSEELIQELSQSEQVLSEILALVSPHAEKVELCLSGCVCGS